MLLCSDALFVALASIFTLLPAKAAVLTLSCNGTMKAEEEQAKPHAITKMGLIVVQSQNQQPPDEDELRTDL